MTTLEFIKKRFNLDFNQELPIKINGSRFKELPKLFRDLGFKVGVEIGVQKGRYSKFLCYYNKGLKLYCVDPWLSYKGYVEQHDDKGQVELNEFLEIAKERLKPFDCTFVRKFSMDAVKDFADESLDFVFIDGNHSFEFVINDIAEWGKKVRKGGIISGHDYWDSMGKRTYSKNLTLEDKIKVCQVKTAVDGWTYVNLIKPWFIFNNDKCPSWMWVKE